MGHLHALWHAALEQQEDGDLSSWSDEFIAESSCYTGDATQYVSLLRKYKWLTDAKLLHDWLDYIGLYLIKKYSTSNRDRLVKIWAKHGRTYGANGKRTESERKVSLPYQPTNQPTNPDKHRASGLPANEREAIDWASMENVPPEFARDVYNQCEGVNWRDGANREITGWRSYIKQRYSKRQEVKAKQKPESGSIQEKIKPKILS
jgi:hypothetical protein